jgi:hypothetical protein
MPTKAYTNQTTLGEFETLAYGDRVWPEAETRNWQKVENRLLAAGVNNYAETLGTFSLAVGGSVSLGINATLTTSGSIKAFSGGLGGYYFRISDTISFTKANNLPLDDNLPWYLYIKKVTGATDPLALDSIETEVTQTLYVGSDLENRLLVVTLYLSGTTISTIDILATGKQEFRSHISTYQNPHGNILEQTVLKTQVLKFDNGSYVYPEYIGEITFPTTSAGQTIVVDLDDVITIPVGKTLSIMFVSCNRLKEVSLAYNDLYKQITFTSGTITGDKTFTYIVKYFLSDLADEITGMTSGSGTYTESVNLMYGIGLYAQEDIEVYAIVTDKSAQVDVSYDIITDIATFSVHGAPTSQSFTFRYFVLYSIINA